MGGLSSGLEALQGMSSAGAASAGADAASSAAAPPRPEVGPFPTMAAAMTPDAGTKMPDASTMLGLSERLMKQLQPPAAAPPGSSILQPTAPVSLPPAPAGNVPLTLQQLFSNTMARRLGNSGSGPSGGASGMFF